MEGPNQKHVLSTSSEEKRLELRLGPPGDHDWTSRETSNLSLGWIMNKNGTLNHKYYNHSLPVRGQDQSQPCSTRTTMDTAVPNSSQKRSAPAPVVGWPPIRSFRRNLASASSSKLNPESQNVVPNKSLSEKPAEKISTQRGFLVKINMDGVPIGRKVDLKVHNSYEKLSSAVDDLFRGLLAAQRDSSAVDIQNKQEGGERETIKGLVNGISGEYTLVYEDNEGDRMLVGDVPWHMFVSTVKRLRVLKTSELSKLSFGPKQEKIVSK